MMRRVEASTHEEHTAEAASAMLVHCMVEHPEVYIALGGLLEVPSDRDAVLRRFDQLDCPCGATRSLFCCDCGELLYALTDPEGCPCWNELQQVFEAGRN